jgi:hypothetical protein
MQELSPELRVWVEGHLVTPRLIWLTRSTQSHETFPYWLVTDHTGADDSSSRVVYDEEHDRFGHELTLEDDREYFVGRIGSFADAVEDL